MVVVKRAFKCIVLFGKRVFENDESERKRDGDRESERMSEHANYVGVNLSRTIIDGCEIDSGKLHIQIIGGRLK